ncbi:hypothetical protein, partial [Helicobacter sp. 11S03491-1]|uniref:hypothetical protein n=1 Tax=Helicobacter sp. 11S03491-1 TaxID=1476196 RepID=UPI00117AF783
MKLNIKEFFTSLCSHIFAYTFIFILIPTFCFGFTGTLNQLQSTYTADTTINEDFTLETTDKFPANFTGIMFDGYTTMNIDPNATVTVNVDSKGFILGFSGPIFRGQNGNTYTINGGNLIFNVNQIQKVGNGLEGMIMTRSQASDRTNANFDINANFSLIASPDVYIQRGVFTSNGPTGGYFKFTKNVFIDVSKMQPSEGFGAGVKSGRGYRMIFSLEGDGAVYLNYNEATGQTLDPKNIIQLKGDLSAEAGSKGNININLDNPQSYFEGRVSIAPGSRSNVELYLNNGGKWFLNATSKIVTLDTNNLTEVVENQYNNIERLAVVDFTKIANDGVSYRLESPNYTPRTLSVNTITGENGVFRLMADVRAGTTDTISANNVNGAQY